jgi:hypothetical protein
VVGVRMRAHRSMGSAESVFEAVVQDSSLAAEGAGESA